MESVVDFDYTNLTATYKNFVNQQESTVIIPDKLLDILSGGFYLRMIPLELGDTVDFNIYADGKIYNYMGLLSSKIKVKLPNYGKQEAYAFKPYLFLNGQQVKKISADVFFPQLLPQRLCARPLIHAWGMSMWFWLMVSLSKLWNQGK